MPKNVIIFSDGTGQGGGLTVDERRSNVYKLYRACRCGPDSAVDPASQLAFYDPGLGSRLASGEKVGFARRVYNLLSQVTGLGLTRNVIDCYAALIRMWEPGDRIYLFGFSRGAYTVRCLSGVIALCGVPTAASSEVRFDLETSGRIAAEAVRGVYRYGAGIKGDPLKGERHALARRFRDRYAANGPDGEPDAAPYLIGVWDTVAALGLPIGGTLQSILAVAAYFVSCLLVAGALASLGRAASPVAPVLDLGYWPAVYVCIAGSAAAAVMLGVGRFVYPPRPELSGRRRWRSAIPGRVKFYDTALGTTVAYARHALAIDENRRDFGRVPWDDEGEAPDAPHAKAGRLKQVWFAGCHSDVGGSYPETESRLSDVALAWMVEEASALPAPIVVDPACLKLFPSPAGAQHDEVAAGISGVPRWLRGIVRWRAADRDVPARAPLHPSVLDRFDFDEVRLYDRAGPYRPEPLRRHERVAPRYL